MAVELDLEADSCGGNVGLPSGRVEERLQCHGADSDRPAKYSGRRDQNVAVFLCSASSRPTGREPDVREPEDHSSMPSQSSRPLLRTTVRRTDLRLGSAPGRPRLGHPLSARGWPLARGAAPQRIDNRIWGPRRSSRRRRVHCPKGRRLTRGASQGGCAMEIYSRARCPG